MKVKSESEVTQSCLTLSDPMDCSLPGSSIHGIFQARVLEWIAIAFSEILPTYHQLTKSQISSSKPNMDRILDIIHSRAKFSPTCEPVKLAGNLYAAVV